MYIVYIENNKYECMCECRKQVPLYTYEHNTTHMNIYVYLT